MAPSGKGLRATARLHAKLWVVVAFVASLISWLRPHEMSWRWRLVARLLAVLLKSSWRVGGAADVGGAIRQAARQSRKARQTKKKKEPYGQIITELHSWTIWSQPSAWKPTSFNIKLSHFKSHWQEAKTGGVVTHFTCRWHWNKTT